MKQTFSKSQVLIIPLIALVIGISSCKNQKKLSELSDPQSEEQISEEVIDNNEEPGETLTNENEPEERVVVKEPTKEAKLNSYFSSISSASSTSSANNSIAEALNIFSSSAAPVLIVIYKANGQPSYDEPTTIEKYLHYLKDTQNIAAKVEEVVYDSNGKIKELVLKK